jgi:hypothetical protein
MIRLNEAISGDFPQDADSLLQLIKDSKEDLMDICKGLGRIANVGTKIAAGSFNQGSFNQGVDPSNTATLLAFGRAPWSVVDGISADDVYVLADANCSQHTRDISPSHTPFSLRC